MPEDLLNDSTSKLEDGIGLCLSGGGYRAMVFHLGALIRLNEVRLLSQLARVSSVSGGSITAGCLGLRWKDLEFDNGRATNLMPAVIDKVREMASTSVDAGAIIGGILLPGTISDRVARAYDDTLFKGAKLADLPAEGKGPRFVINATNVQSAVLWRFSRNYMGDYMVGLVKNPDVKLSLAVAASSAFPPVLSPVDVPIKGTFDPAYGGTLTGSAYRKKVVLSDGGVYDNLGLETVIKRYRTVLVSDGGQKTAPEADPRRNWAQHSIRILDVIDNQVRSLRKRQLIDSYLRKDRTGAYWGIRTDFANYKLGSDPLKCAARNPTPLAETPTRLEAMPSALQEKLINWGYAVTDAALRKHIGPELRQKYKLTMTEPKFPYPRGY